MGKQPWNQDTKSYYMGVITKRRFVCRHKRKSKRPAITISPKEYNEKTGLSIFCPITSKIKNYPFEVQIANKKINGVVLSDQIKNLDWETREAEFIIKKSPEKVEEIVNKINVLLFELRSYPRLALKASALCFSS